MLNHTGSNPRRPYELTPRTLTSMLTSLLNDLLDACVHRSVVHQFFRQVVHFLSGEIFNRIVTSPTLRCRSRALPLRINVGVLEEWCRENSRFIEPDPDAAAAEAAAEASGVALLRGDSGVQMDDTADTGADTPHPPSPSSPSPSPSRGRRKQRQIGASSDGAGSGGAARLFAMFRPTVQLTQFLQVISSIDDLAAFLETMKGLDRLTIAQARMAMEGYRYEWGEPSFPEEVEAYVIKVADDLFFALQEEEEAQLGRLQQQADGGVSAASSPGDAAAAAAATDEAYGGALQAQMRVLYEPRRRLPFQAPAFSGTDDDAGWTWCGAVPFVPTDVLALLDTQSMEELGDG
ncbi:hypothetical protein HK405_005125, partial [Cladochytrium tenue]